jgi:hypothetical protein
VNDVRCNAVACSFTTLISRFQQISSVTGSSGAGDACRARFGRGLLRTDEAMPRALREERRGFVT